MVLATIENRGTATQHFTVDFRPPPPQVTINSHGTATYLTTMSLVDYRPLLKDIRRSRMTLAERHAEEDRELWLQRLLGHGDEAVPPVVLTLRGHPYRGTVEEPEKSEKGFWRRLWSWMGGST